MAVTTLTKPTAEIGSAPPRRTGRRSASRRIGRALGYTALAVAAAGVLLPFFWMVMSSLKTALLVFRDDMTIQKKGSSTPTAATARPV